MAAPCPEWGRASPREVAKRVRGLLRGAGHPQSTRPRRRVQVNLGAGEAIEPGYLNLDIRHLPGLDLVADVRRLPFRPRSVDVLRHSHLMEHFTNRDMRETLLPSWVALLRPGAVMHVVVPDFETAARRFVQGSLPLDRMRQVIFAKQDDPLRFHYAIYTHHELHQVLVAAGLECVQLVGQREDEWGLPELQVVARRPLWPDEHRGTPVVTVATPVHDALDSLRACIAAVREHTPLTYEHIVIDDSSSSVTVAWLEEQAASGQIRLLQTNEFTDAAPPNLGLSYNLAVAHMHPDSRALITVESDVFVRPGWLASLLRVAMADPRIGAVSGLLIDEHGNVAYSVAADEYEGTPTAGMPEDELPEALAKPLAVDAAQTSMLYVRRDVLDAGVRWDPQFRLWFADFDFTSAIRQAGFGIYYAPEARAVHQGGQSSGGDDRHDSFADAQARLCAKWESRAFARPRAADPYWLRAQNALMAHVETAEGAGALASRPQHVTIDVNHACNLQCVMCIPHRNTDDCMDMAVYRRIGDELFPWAHEIALFGNGEPLLAAHFGEMVRIARQHEPPRLTTSTNATLVDDKAASFLVSNFDAIQVSIDGATAATYESIRVGASFDEVVRNIARLTRARRAHARPVTIRFCFVAMSRNIGELPELVTLAADLAVDEVVVQHLVVYRPALRSESLYSSNSDSWIGFVDAAEEVAAESGVAFHRPVTPSLARVAPQRRRSGERQRTAKTCPGRVCTPCDRPWRTVTVEVNGRVKCCSQGDGFGSVATEPFPGVWNGPEAQRLRGVLASGLVPSMCRTCPPCDGTPFDTVDEAAIYRC